MPYRRFLSVFMVTAILAAVFASTTPIRAQSSICYVNQAATASGSGTSWTEAYRDLQSALRDSCAEVWVAEGTYTPGNGRWDTFEIGGKVLYGSFAGTETAVSQRDPAAHQAILSGDIGAVGTNSDNSFHVVTSTGGATLDGFTVSGGYGGNGSGLYHAGGTLIVSNCTFSGNTANQGGGLYHLTDTLTLTNSTFSNNHANSHGGGLVNRATMTVTNSTFSGNSAGLRGGGLFNEDSGALFLANSTFSANTAGNQGGGLYNYRGMINVTNATISGNSAQINGGGFYNLVFSTATVVNTLLANNLGGNCAGDMFIHGSSNMQSGDSSCTGVATISNPLLSGLADNGGPTQTMALQPGSPAIDAGDAAVCAATPVGNRDQRGVIRTLGASCDIGAYESGASVLRVTASMPADGARLQDVTTLAVTFNEDAVHDGGAQAANNPANYLLVERGANHVFDTQSCEIGPQVDDVRQTISSVTYSDRGGTGPFTAILNLKAPLAAGVYRLYACGTTSIWSAAGLELNNGASDTLINFSVPARASAIPATGFAPGRVTALQAQPEEKTYGDLGSLWLEVPKLGVKMAIVGVPLTDGQWDVTWLGSSAGWLEGSAYPTWQGNSVLTGHVWNADNTAGPFRDLETLGWGDEIIVHLGDQAYVYSVRSSQEVQPAKVGALLKPEKQAWLTLVTCKGYDENKGEYNSRILVRAVLLEVR